jgi:hypothetical protein
MPEQDAAPDYFADASHANDRSEVEQALEGVLNDDLADDVASAWGQESVADDLLANLV